MSKKTLRLKWIRDRVNTYLAYTDECRHDERLALANFLEQALFECGDYQGFKYLSSDEMQVKGKPGIIRVEGQPNVFLDDSRRYYL